MRVCSIQEFPCSELSLFSDFSRVKADCPLCALPVVTENSCVIRKPSRLTYMKGRKLILLDKNKSLKLETKNIKRFSISILFISRFSPNFILRFKMSHFHFKLCFSFYLARNISFMPDQGPNQNEESTPFMKVDHFLLLPAARFTRDFCLYKNYFLLFSLRPGKSSLASSL